MFLITIPGTHELFHEDGWWQPDSDWWMEAYDRGFEHPAPDDPFFWSTDLEGTMGENYEWMAAGAALDWYVRTYIGSAPLALVAWSHGGQIAAHFMNRYRWRKEINPFLVTLGTPVRPEMYDIYRGASQHSWWTHVFSTSDLWQIAGEISDRNWTDFGRRMPWADKNIDAGEERHDTLTKLWFWDGNNLWDYITEKESVESE